MALARDPTVTHKRAKELEVLGAQLVVGESGILISYRQCDTNVEIIFASLQALSWILSITFFQ